MQVALPRDAGRQCRPGTEGTFWRRRGLVWSSPWGSYRVRQGRGIIVVACIGAPCPCRPVIIGLSWRPITIGVLPVQRWCCKHSNTFTAQKLCWYQPHSCFSIRGCIPVRALRFILWITLSEMQLLIYSCWITVCETQSLRRQSLSYGSLTSSRVCISHQEIYVLSDARADSQADI